MIRYREVLLLMCLFVTQVHSATYYVQPGASNSNPGTQASPFGTLQKAHDVAVAGDTIYMRGGTFLFAAQTTLNRDGNSGNPIRVFNFPGEVPIIDGINMPSNAYAIFGSGANWWHIKGLEITRGPQGGIRCDDCNNDIIEFNNVHHNGQTATSAGKGIVFYHTGSNNLILNNDSHHNKDLNIQNADGFDLATLGTGNVWRGNRAWRNSDDGFDNFCIDDNQICKGVLIENNWSFENGCTDTAGSACGGLLTSGGGNGNGFKLGGVRAGTTGQAGGHTVRNNLAFRNLNNGFDNNCSSNSASQCNPSTLNNNTSWNNQGGNYIFFTNPSTFHNNISYATSAPGQITGTATFNSWQLPVTVDSADFSADDSVACARSARQADGSLPNCTFLHLVSGSDLRDKGTNVGIAFNGSAPDLGAYEFGAAGGSDVTAPTVSITAPVAGATVSGTTTTISANANDNVAVVGVQFKLDGAVLNAEDTTSPYSTVWDTTLSSNASHSLTAVARDANGNSTTSASISVTVDNVAQPPSGPKSYWPFNESVGASIAIDTASGNNISFVGGASMVTGGQTGNALSLNGTNGSAQDTSTANINSTSALTIAAWVKPNLLPAGAFATILAKGSLGSARGYGLNIFDGKLSFVKIGNTDVTSTVTVPVGGSTNPNRPTGQDIAVWLAGDSTMDYYDPATRAPLTGWGMPFTSDSFQSGVRVDNQAESGRDTAEFLAEGRYQFIVDRLRVTDYVFIQFGHNDEASLTTSQYSANLTNMINLAKAKGAIPILLTPVTRYSFNGNTALQTHAVFSPVARQVATNTNTMLIDLDALSVALNQSLGPTAARARYMSGDTTHFNVQGARGIADLVLTDLTSQGNELASYKLTNPVPVAVGTFHHIAVTWDVATGQVKFYLDKVLADTKTSASAIAPPVDADILTVGKFLTSASFYYGLIDDLRLYDRALTATQISSIGTDDVPPSVSITSPLNGQIITGTFVISANASDAVSVSGVQFKLDGVNLGAEDTTFPYSLSVDTNAITSGQHVITAVARDGSANTANSSPISITINNVDVCP